MESQIVCAKCGSILDESYNIDPHKKCPQCGSVEQTILFFEKDAIEIHEGIRAKCSDSSFPRSKNPRYDYFQGDDRRKSDGRWMKKKRLIEKDRDIYRETVSDPDTGQVIHSCEEPLSSHKGQGSAKKNNV